MVTDLKDGTIDAAYGIPAAEFAGLSPIPQVQDLGDLPTTTELPRVQLLRQGEHAVNPVGVRTGASATPLNTR